MINEDVFVFNHYLDVTYIRHVILIRKRYFVTVMGLLWKLFSGNYCFGYILTLFLLGVYSRGFFFLDSRAHRMYIGLDKRPFLWLPQICPCWEFSVFPSKYSGNKSIRYQAVEVCNDYKEGFMSSILGMWFWSHRFHVELKMQLTNKTSEINMHLRQIYFHHLFLLTRGTVNNS